MTETAAWGLGIGLVLFGPFLNLGLLWVIATQLESFFPARFSLNASYKYLVAAFALLGFHLVLVVPGLINFAHVCKTDGQLFVSERMKVDAVYFDRLMEHEAEFLLRPSYATDVTPRPFRTIEFKASDRNGVVQRFALDENGAIARTTVPMRHDGNPNLIARYGVNKRYVDFGFTSGGFRTVIYEISTGREIAKNAAVMFNGGWLQFLRFMIGVSRCPADDTHDGAVSHRLPEYVLGGYEPHK